MKAVVNVRSTPGRALTNGVVLPWSAGCLARILAGVYPSDPSPTVVLAAPDALSLAGLRRVASLVGLRECDDADSASMSLRHRGWGERHSGLDVEVGEDAVTVRVDRPPSPDTWSRLYAVLAVLSGGSDAGGVDAPGTVAG
jgi:hypothetical protein